MDNAAQSSPASTVAVNPTGPRSVMMDERGKSTRSRAFHRALVGASPSRLFHSKIVVQPLLFQAGFCLVGRRCSLVAFGGGVSRFILPRFGLEPQAGCVFGDDSFDVVGEA
jgi:hypothetical protein